jgi:hypothetical protein
MRSRSILLTVAAAAALSLPAVASADATGTVAGLRAQVQRLITAELTGDGATVCAILNAPLTVTHHGVTCTARWDAKLARLKHAGRHRLHADMAASQTAPVNSDGTYASITLPHPLLKGQSKFYWYDNCWMLMG